MKSRRILAVLIACLFGFAQLGFAQDEHNHDSQHEEHMDHEKDKEHDHSEHEHSDAEAMDKVMGKGPNVIALGDTALMLEPLIDPSGAMKIAFTLMSADAMKMSDMDMSHDDSMSKDEDHREGEHDGEMASEHEHSEEMTSENMASEHEHSENMASDSMGQDMAMMTIPVDLSISTPSGETIAVQREDESNIVVNLGQVKSGDYLISGLVGMNEVSTSISVYQGQTDLESEVITVLAPTPSVNNGAMTQLFIYAFSDGENIHKSFMVDRNMPGMSHMTDEEQITLVHNHFLDAYNTASFTPMTNNAILDFAMPGEWELNVNIVGSVPELANFVINVEGE